MSKKSRVNRLTDDAVAGANAEALVNNEAFRSAFIQLKADTLSDFESCDSADSDGLKYLHAKYANISEIEEFLIKRIKEGARSQNKLKSINEGKENV